MLKVADIMTANPVTAAPDTPLADVVIIMKQHHCRQIPVVTGDKLAGIITDRDVRLVMNSPLVLHERADDQALLTHVPAEACMTASPLTIDADAPAVEAARLLYEHKYGGLPVLQEGRLVGIVTVSDILASYISELTSQS